jgi:hypothetical protein
MSKAGFEGKVGGVRDDFVGKAEIKKDVLLLSRTLRVGVLQNGLRLHEFPCMS